MATSDPSAPPAIADDPLHSELDALLAPHGAALGADRAGYTGHVHRMAGLVLAQAPRGLTPTERGQLAIAAAFHDLGIWTAGTFDYLDPSIQLAVDHLHATGQQAWAPRVTRLIALHHQLRPVRDDALVEAFRRADLADLTFGRLRRGIPASAWPALHAHWPIAGFHRRLILLTAAQARRQPWRPLPMLRF